MLLYTRIISMNAVIDWHYRHKWYYVLTLPLYSYVITYSYHHYKLYACITSTNSTIYSFCTNIWNISTHSVAPWAVNNGLWRAPCFVLRATPPHGEWSSVRLIWNNSIMIRNTILEIIVKDLDLSSYTNYHFFGYFFIFFNIFSLE